MTGADLLAMCQARPVRVETKSMTTKQTGATRSRSQGQIKSNPAKGTGKGKGTGTDAARILGKFANLDGYQIAARGLLGHAVAGDITGNHGTGKGAARLRPARPVGVGLDDETRAAQDFAEWCASAPGRAIIGEQVARDASGWAALQFMGKGAARRAAQKLEELRGVKASVTSREDAAADAVAMVARRFPQGCLALRNFAPGSGRLRVLARIASGAAWQSLSRWSVAGMTGKTGGKGKGKGAHGARIDWRAASSGALEQVAAEDASPAPYAGPEGAARRAACRWVYRVGLVQFRATLADYKPGPLANAISGARRRCRVLSSVLLGQSLFDSCAVHGFDSVAAFVNSCQKSGILDALRADRARQAADGADYDAHRVAMRRFALDAARLSRELRAARSQARGAALSVVGAGGTMRATTSRARRVADSLISPRILRRELSRVVALATWHRDAMRAAMRADLDAFGRILARLTDDEHSLADLRAALGIVDRKGRVRRVSKLDASGIRRAKGSIARRAPVAPVVMLDLRTRYSDKPRAMACAPLA
jgi:hypothetical protein